MNSHPISHQTLTSLVSQLIGGYPSDHDPPPPGPWDPVIRKALSRLGPHPEPWRMGGFSQPWLVAGLNPQPLPPRIALALALTDVMVERTQELYDLAQALPDDAAQSVSSHAQGKLTQFVDDCGNGRVKRWPFPWPPPFAWQDGVLEPFELFVMGARLASAARESFDERLQVVFSGASETLTSLGAARL